MSRDLIFSLIAAGGESGSIMASVVVPTLIITGLIIANGIFVAAEFAIIVSSRPALEAAAARGDRLAKMVLQAKIHPANQDRYIAAAQLGITLSSLGLGMYGEHLLAERIAHWLEGTELASPAVVHTLATILAIIILTYFHIVIGEMVPKSLALSQGEKTARAVAVPMRWFQVLMYPFVALLNGIGWGVLKLLRVERADHGGHSYTAEEIEMVVEESREGGLLGSVEADVFHELLDFAELDAKEVMVPRVRVAGIPHDAPWEDVLQLVSEKSHTRYPVYSSDLDHIVGVLHVKDVLRAQSLDEALHRSVPFIPETAPLTEILGAMNEHRTQLAVVLDEYGGTAGVVTINDIHEEIVGQIDEPVEERAYIWSGDVLIADGTLRLDETGELLDLKLEHPEVDTLGGLVLAMLNRPARRGDEVEYEGCLIRVLRTDENSIKQCRVWKKA